MAPAFLLFSEAVIEDFPLAAVRLRATAFMLLPQPPLVLRRS